MNETADTIERQAEEITDLRERANVAQAEVERLKAELRDARWDRDAERARNKHLERDLAAEKAATDFSDREIEKGEIRLHDRTLERDAALAEVERLKDDIKSEAMKMVEDMYPSSEAR